MLENLVKKGYYTEYSEIGKNIHLSQAIIFSGGIYNVEIKGSNYR